MRFFILIFSLIIASNTLAIGFTINTLNGKQVEKPTSFADFSGGTDLISSKGSNAITTTASRGSSNPATYIDSSGVMQVTTTSNVARSTQGYYDMTGYHAFDNAGLMIEGQRTNYAIRSTMDTGTGPPTDHSIVFGVGGSADTNELIDATSIFNVGPTVNYWHIVYENTADGENITSQQGPSSTTIGSFSQNDYCTLSVFIKGEIGGTAALRIIEADAASVSGTIHSSSQIHSYFSSSKWRLFVFTVQLVDADASKVKVHIRMESLNQSQGGGFDINYALFQVEEGQGVTSHIPTVGAALTRNSETHTFLALNNRNSTIESMVCKLALNSGDSVDGDRGVVSTSLPNRYVKFQSQDDALRIYPNLTDSETSSVLDLIDTSFEANMSLTIGYNMQAGISPYVSGFYNGVTNGTNETSDDFIENIWSSDLSYIGSNKDGDNQLNGVIFQLAFFDNILTDEQHLQGYRDGIRNIKRAL